VEGTNVERRFLKPEEVADVLSVTVAQVYTLMRTGQLKAVKIGKRGVWRVSNMALDEYIAELEGVAPEVPAQA
jgi:excisionase family DNA binding protein